MPSRGLHPDVLLDITLSSTISRNRYTPDPGPVIAELYDRAGDRLDILTHVVGLWVGYNEIPETRTLCEALRALPLDMDDALALGKYRRDLPANTTTGFLGPDGRRS